MPATVIEGMKCIFCLREPPAIQLTEEHVFPESMGATLTVGFVCKSCNDALGSGVDVELTEHPMIQMIRLALHIPTKSGELAQPLHNARIPGHPGIVVSYIAKSPGATGVVKPRPKVVRFTGPDGRTYINVQALPEESKLIVQKIQERAEKAGKSVTLHSRGAREVRGSVIEKTTQSSDGAIVRPLLKVAYELGALVLGDAYADDPRASHLRAAISSGNVRGVWGEIAYFDGSAFNLPEVPGYCHVAAVWRANDRAWCSVRVFNVLQAVILLSEQAKSYAGGERLFVFDPLARRHFEHSPATRPEMTFPDTDAGIRWERSETDPQQIAVYVTYKGVEDTKITLTFGGPPLRDASPRGSP